MTASVSANGALFALFEIDASVQHQAMTASPRAIAVKDLFIDRIDPIFSFLMIVSEWIMSVILLLMVMLFAAYLLMPTTWFSKAAAEERRESAGGQSTGAKPVIPEDSVLRRHFITQLRSEIEKELYAPRPCHSTDAILQRHYDAMVDTELENRLGALSA
ncbi:MAG: hypothetical protein ACXV7J_09410 [Methylomonas sp.]